jgi:hypothetical protein
MNETHLFSVILYRAHAKTTMSMLSWDGSDIDDATHSQLSASIHSLVLSPSLIYTLNLTKITSKPNYQSQPFTVISNSKPNSLYGSFKEYLVQMNTLMERKMSNVRIRHHDIINES